VSFDYGFEIPHDLELLIESSWRLPNGAKFVLDSRVVTEKLLARALWTSLVWWSNEGLRKQLYHGASICPLNLRPVHRTLPWDFFGASTCAQFDYSFQLWYLVERSPLRWFHPVYHCTDCLWSDLNWAVPKRKGVLVNRTPPLADFILS